jgi:hypothetical protein
MLVMLIPMVLVLSQLALWYQARPLQVGEEAVVTAHLKAKEAEALPEVLLENSSFYEVVAGPGRVPAKHMVCWNIVARESGEHRLRFRVHDDSVTKELVIGNSLMPVSLQRPRWNWGEAILHPREAPFSQESAVDSIEVTYPARAAWTYGTKTWLIYWFIVSLVAAFAVKPIFKVNI